MKDDVDVPHSVYRHLCRFPACHSPSDPARITIDPVGRFDLTSAAILGHVDPVLRVLDTVMLLAIKDRIREIRFEPKQNAYEIRFVIPDEIYELVPPPSWLHFPIAKPWRPLPGLT